MPAMKDFVNFKTIIAYFESRTTDYKKTNSQILRIFVA